MAEQKKTTTKTKRARTKKRAKRSIPAGQLHIHATFNNTIITITDTKGNALTSASAGASGFRGSKKGTAYAAQIASENAITNAVNQFGLKKVDVFVKDIGLGRDAAIRGLHAADVQVNSIKDVTGIPHGGVRPKKARKP